MTLQALVILGRFFGSPLAENASDSVREVRLEASLITLVDFLLELLNLHLCLLGPMFCLEIVQLIFHGMLFVKGHRFAGGFCCLILLVGRVELGLLNLDFFFKSQDLFCQIFLRCWVDFGHVELLFS